MARAFADIAFTPSVKAARSRYGSRRANERMENAKERGDELTEEESEFIEARDDFYQATVSETGWPFSFGAAPEDFSRSSIRRPSAMRIFAAMFSM